MALLNILQYPEPFLRNKAKPVTEFGPDIAREVQDMFDTMYEQNGVGLAAIQVAIPKQIIVIDVSESRDKPLCLINPEIIHEEETQFDFEGCLSFPGVFDKVERKGKIRVKAFDRDGKPFEITAEGLLSVCIQHEMDHLNGVLFIDHLSRLKQDRLKRKLEKLRRQML